MATGSGGTLYNPNGGGNTNSGSGSFGPAPKKHTKKRPANQNAGQGVARDRPKQKTYKWPNGSIHSRPFRGHGGGGGGGHPAPPKVTAHPLMDQAQAQADLRYGGAESSLNQRSQAIAPWFQNYMNEVGGAQAAQQTYAAPVLAQAQTAADQAGQQAPGLDPNTPAGHDAALAAAARNALGNAFVTTLGGISQTQQDFYAGRKAVAATAEVGEQSRVAREKTDLKKEKGAYKVDALQKIKDDKRQAKLENAAFGIKATTAASSLASSQAQLNKYGYTDAEWASMADAKRNRIRNKTSQGSQPDLGNINKYGYSDKQWRGFSVGKRQQIMKTFDKSGGKDKAGLTPNERRTVRKERGKAINRIKEIPSLYSEYSKRKKYVDKDKGITAPLTPQDIKALLRKDGYSQSEINVALRVKSGKPLSAGQRATARRLGIYPIPKAWKQGRTAVLNRPPQTPGANGEYRPT